MKAPISYVCFERADQLRLFAELNEWIIITLILTKHNETAETQQV